MADWALEISRGQNQSERIPFPSIFHSIFSAKILLSYYSFLEQDAISLSGILWIPLPPFKKQAPQPVKTAPPLFLAGFML